MKFIYCLFSFLLATLTVNCQKISGDWFNLNPSTDNVEGVAAKDALVKFQSKTLQPVIVAIIDDGVDITHPDLAGKIWTNAGEIPGNGIDDDGNGYVDDVHGWNYLGNPSGENVGPENLELTRLYRDMLAIFGNVNTDTLTKAEKNDFKKFQAYEAEYKLEVARLEAEFQEYAQLAALYKGALSYMQEKLNTDDLSINGLFAYQPQDDDDAQVRNFLIMAEQEGLPTYLLEGGEYFEEALNFHYNLEFTPRDIVNVRAAGEKGIAYGNNMVWAENPQHGTHVAGIIAATRNNGEGINGIAPNAVIMPIRAIPAGDERDEDVALAIRYAVDNGAKVVNMSFGKSYSPKFELVYDAIRYAADNNVLLVHAAGNDGSNNDKIINYPDGTLGGKKSTANWISVAANGSQKDTLLLADFSNYGRKGVDVMAPGVDIESLVPKGQTKSLSGTSMASPVIAGVAAVLRGAYPNLGAEEIKWLITASISNDKNEKVSAGNGKVKLKKLIKHPGTPSLLRAMELASQKYPE